MNANIRRDIRLVAISLLLSAFPIACFADSQTVNSIINLKQPQAQILVGGQPDTSQLNALAEADIKHVINLRPQTELPKFPEEDLVRTAEMSYHLLPVASIDDLSLANVQALDQLIEQAGDEKIFIHCASGNRVGAMMALRSALIYGEDPQRALEIGKTWGMTSLEAEIRQLLNKS